ncbi:hypothetical protein ACFFGV_04075 [Pontibacillus salicampi]|uniref:Uncharacterized protein n=1 Tax=Pontibacillus salicampi TaxID=1449801 RepID=A0ABV6LKC4_9BACI
MDLFSLTWTLMVGIIAVPIGYYVTMKVNKRLGIATAAGIPIGFGITFTTLNTFYAAPIAVLLLIIIIGFQEDN